MVILVDATPESVIPVLKSMATELRTGELGPLDGMRLATWCDAIAKALTVPPARAGWPGLAAVEQTEPLPGPYRVDPLDSTPWRTEWSDGYEEGYTKITNVYGGEARWVKTVEYHSWRVERRKQRKHVLNEAAHKLAAT